VKIQPGLVACQAAGQAGSSDASIEVKNIFYRFCLSFEELESS
jgi:hypothetical protein